MVILPKSLTAGTEAKAADVMADFNAIVSQVNGLLDATNLAESIRNALIPTGSVMATARSTAPTGYLLCQGQAISRTTYAVLFAAIGTTHGNGDGTTTFNLPDLRGRVPVGVDAGANRVPANNILGQSAGHYNMQIHQHANGGGTGIESAVHSHGLGWQAAFNNIGGASVAQIIVAGGFTNTTGENANHVHALTGFTQNEGLGNGQNMPPYQCLQWMIKI